jgi:hypothetical protein
VKERQQRAPGSDALGAGQRDADGRPLKRCSRRWRRRLPVKWLHLTSQLKVRDLASSGEGGWLEVALSVDNKRAPPANVPTRSGWVFLGWAC